MTNEYALCAHPGTRWLLRWDKEIELFTKLAYLGLTTRYGMAAYTKKHRLTTCFISLANPGGGVY